MQNFYLTTTLPYVNGEPHIGHTLEFIQSDTIVRFMRQHGASVYFNTGTDEHGLKMYENAIKEGITPQEYVDKNAQRFQDFCKLFEISYDRFIRTTDPDHILAAQKFWQASLSNGDIYKKEYKGLYCVGCEEFKTEKDLENGKCPNHPNKELITHEEENYFFKFSKYQKQLLELYENKPDFVKPTSKLQEMVSFVSRGLHDFSISRKKENLPWGVPVPGDSEQVMYVWFDALVNYVTTVGYSSDDEMFAKWWPVVQLCGPDNNRFQSAMWQAMLMSAGLASSKHILVHGMILAEDGTKMSKTVGNVISPFELLQKYPLDAIRYYMVSGIPTFGDTSFSYEVLESKYRSELQNNFGNLLNRTITMILKKNVKIDPAKITPEFRSKVDELKSRYVSQMLEYEVYQAMENTQALGDLGNGYITEQAPWDKSKTQEQVEEVLNNLNYLLETLIWCLTPVIPSSCEKARLALQKMENIILFAPLDKE